jgi:hypothetical protein
MLASADNPNRDWAWLFERRCEKTIAALRRGNMEGSYCPSREEALMAVLSLVPPGLSVSRGDSVTLDQIGVMAALEERGQNVIINPFQKDSHGVDLLDEHAQRDKMREALLADVFLTGTSALTLDGKLVNVDGLGNRVAGMIFGPRKVIVVAGANKIVADVDAAIKRIRGIAGPMDARRVHPGREGHELPCVRTGICTDCRHEDRICNCTVIIERSYPVDRGRIHVVLVGETLGY